MNQLTIEEIEKKLETFENYSNFDVATKVLYLDRAITQSRDAFVQSLDKLDQLDQLETYNAQQLDIILTLKTINDLCVNDQTIQVSKKQVQKAVYKHINRLLVKYPENFVKQQCQERFAYERTAPGYEWWRWELKLPRDQKNLPLAEGQIVSSSEESDFINKITRFKTIEEINKAVDALTPQQCHLALSMAKNVSVTVANLPFGFPMLVRRMRAGDWESEYISAEILKKMNELASENEESQQGYILVDVLAHGDSGYHAYYERSLAHGNNNSGESRKKAVELLLARIDASQGAEIEEISKIMSAAVKEALFLETAGFREYLRSLDPPISINDADWQGADLPFDRYLRDKRVLLAYISFDVEAKQMGITEGRAGYAHPAILQLLAYFEDVDLCIWELDQNKLLQPFCVIEENYSVSLSSTGSNNRRRHDIVYVNKYHFQIVKFHGYNSEEIPASDIPPFGKAAIRNAIPVLYVEEPTVDTTTHSPSSLIVTAQTFFRTVFYVMAYAVNLLYKISPVMVLFPMAYFYNGINPRNTQYKNVTTLGERDLMFLSDKKYSALLVAGHFGHIDIVKLLVTDKRFNRDQINAQDVNGAMVLWWAAKEGRLEIVKFLLEHNADPLIADEKNVSAIQIAEQEGHTEIAELLKKHVEDSFNKAAALGLHRFGIMDFCLNEEQGDACSNRANPYVNH